MLKNHWYAIEFGSAVDLTPVAVRVFGQDLVLYRDCLGAMVCHSDVCVHCGGSLAGGSVVGDRLRCGGCGREYDLDGLCARLPDAEPDAPIPANARLDSYPSVEQYGFIFVFLGDLPGNRRPPGPRLPVLDVMPYAQAHAHRVVSGEVSWDANYERVLEASVGIERVRALYAGDGESSDPRATETMPPSDYALEESHVGLWLTGVVGSVTLIAPAASGLRRRAAKAPVAPVTRVGVFFPNLTFVETPAAGGSMTIVTAVVPVDRDHCISKWTMLRTFAASSIGDGSARRRMKRLAELQRPFLEAGDTGPLAYHDESEPDAVEGGRSEVTLDAVRDAYRCWRQTVLSWGWGSEEAPVGGYDDWSESRVIASPARRFPPESAEAWVLGELDPLVVHREA